MLPSRPAALPMAVSLVLLVLVGCGSTLALEEATSVNAATQAEIACVNNARQVCGSVVNLCSAACQSTKFITFSSATCSSQSPLCSSIQSSCIKAQTSTCVRTQSAVDLPSSGALLSSLQQPVSAPTPRRTFCELFTSYHCGAAEEECGAACIASGCPAGSCDKARRQCNDEKFTGCMEKVASLSTSGPVPSSSSSASAESSQSQSSSSSSSGSMSLSASLASSAEEPQYSDIVEFPPTRGSESSSSSQSASESSSLWSSLSSESKSSSRSSSSASSSSSSSQSLDARIDECIEKERGKCKGVRARCEKRCAAQDNDADFGKCDADECLRSFRICMEEIESYKLCEFVPVDDAQPGTVFCPPGDKKCEVISPDVVEDVCSQESRSTNPEACQAPSTSAVSSCNECEQQFFECVKEGTCDFQKELVFDSATKLQKQTCRPAPVSHVRNCETARDSCHERECRRTRADNLVEPEVLEDGTTRKQLKVVDEKNTRAAIADGLLSRHLARIACGDGTLEWDDQETLCRCLKGLRAYKPLKLRCSAIKDVLQGKKTVQDMLDDEGILPMAPATCGNGKVDNGEDCDGGEGCKYCSCTPSFTPFDPPRKSCSGGPAPCSFARASCMYGLGQIRAGVVPKGSLYQFEHATNSFSV